MLFSTSGVAATGVGASPIGIDGSVPGTLSTLVAGAQYGPPWISTSEIVFQDCTSTCILEKYNTGSTALTTLSSNGSNIQGAGNGIWALARVGAGLITNNAAGNFPAGWLGDVSPHGELAVILTYPELKGLRVYDSGGSPLITNLDNAQLVVGLVRVRGHVLAYQTQAGWQIVSTINASVSYAPRTDDNIGWVTPIRLSAGQLYLMERSDRLTVRLSDASSGYEIASVGTFTYNPDALEVSPGVLRFGWCSSQGETADSLFVGNLTLSTGFFELYGVSGGVLVLVSSTTLSPVNFSVGPVQGSGGGILALPNDQQSIVGPKGASSPPMRKWMLEVSKRVAGNSSAIAAIPPASAQSSFGTITSGSEPPVVASKAGDTLELEAGSGMTILTDPVTKKVSFASSGGGGSVTTTGSPASGNLTKFSGASSITNGDLSGDVTTSGTLATTIPNDTVTYAKMQNVSAASRILGRGSAAGSGDVQELTVDGTSITITGTVISAPGGGSGTVTTTGSPATGNLTKFSGATSITNADLTGDVTTSGTVGTTIAANAVTTTKINNAAVTLAKIQNATANSKVLGSGSSGSGSAYSEISLGSGLSMSGTTLSATGSGGTVTTTGSPASGNLTKFSGSTSITNGDLTGDVTTSGSLAATIANAAVTLAKIANATSNSVVLGSGSSGSGASYSELTLGTGLSISGTTLSATTGAGSLVLLEEHDASSSSSLNFTTCITSTYDEYLIEILNLLNTTNNRSVNFRMSTDGGSTYDSGSNYAYAGIRWSGSGNAASGASSQTQIDIGVGDNTHSTTSDGGLSGSLRLISPLSTAHSKWLYGQVAYITDTGSIVGAQLSAVYAVNTAANAFQFFPGSSDTFASGSIRVYGVAK